MRGCPAASFTTPFTTTSLPAVASSENSPPPEIWLREVFSCLYRRGSQYGSAQHSGACTDVTTGLGFVKKFHKKFFKVSVRNFFAILFDGFSDVSFLFFNWWF